jgi:hypothetical protein
MRMGWIGDRQLCWLEEEVGVVVSIAMIRPELTGVKLVLLQHKNRSQTQDKTHTSVDVPRLAKHSLEFLLSHREFQIDMEEGFLRSHLKLTYSRRAPDLRSPRVYVSAPLRPQVLFGILISNSHITS